MKYLLIIIILLFSIFGLAQNSVSGYITDVQDDEPLVGVNIYIPDLSTGTVTDTNGFYQITNLSRGEHIFRFSFIGYQTQFKTLFISQGDLQLNISMDIEVIHGEEVVISGNFTSTQHDNTIKISTVSIDQITKSGNPSLIGAIGDVPGVSVIAKGPGIVTPVIRGLSLSNILLLSNSVPMENFQFSANHPYLVDENGLECVEIIKGPASLIYGSGAVGGVINLLPQPVAEKDKVSGDVNMTYFSNTVGLLSNLGFKGNHNGFVWGVRAGMNSNKDYIQGNGDFVPNTRFNRYNVKGDIGLIKKAGIFRIFYEYSHNNFGLAILPAFQLVKENGRENEVWYQNLTNQLIHSQNKIFLGNIKLDINLAYQNNKRKLMGNPASDPVKRVDMTLQTFSYRIKSQYNFNEEAKIIFGIQGQYQDNKNGEAPDHVLPDATINDISVYGLAQYSLNRFKFEAGLRYSYRDIFVPRQEAGGHSHDDDHEDEEEYIQFDGQYDNLSTSIGTTITLNNQNLIRLNLASAFRSPNLAELTQFGVHANRFEEGNPNLKTQQNMEADLGYHLHTKHTTLDLSVFYNHVNNYIYLSPTSDTTDEGILIYRYSQSNASLYGGEASLHIHPHPLDWLHIKSTFAYVIGQQRDGNYLPFIPAQNLNLELRVEKQQWKTFYHIYLQGGIHFVFDQNKPSVFEASTEGYNLLSMGFGFDLKINQQMLNFSVTATNLLNVSYYDHLSTLKDLGIYNMGRNIAVNLRIPFGIIN